MKNATKKTAAADAKKAMKKNAANMRKALKLDAPKAEPKAELASPILQDPKLAATGPNEKFPFGIEVTGPTGHGYERFKTADIRDLRLAVLKGTAGTTATAVDHKAAKPAPTAAKAAKPAKAAKAPKAEKPADDTLSIHVNKTGRICFGKNAATRINGFKYMTITAEGKKLVMAPGNRASDGAIDINLANGRPYVSAMRLLKGLGFDGAEAIDAVAKPVGDNGLEFRVA